MFPRTLPVADRPVLGRWPVTRACSTSSTRRAQWWTTSPSHDTRCAARAVACDVHALTCRVYGGWVSLTPLVTLMIPVVRGLRAAGLPATSPGRRYRPGSQPHDHNTVKPFSPGTSTVTAGRTEGLLAGQGDGGFDVRVGLNQGNGTFTAPGVWWTTSAGPSYTFTGVQPIP